MQPEASNVFSQVDKNPETECERPSTAEDAAPPTTHDTESDSKQVLKNPLKPLKTPNQTTLFLLAFLLLLGQFIICLYVI